MDVGYWLSCEEYGPGELVEQAVLAEEAGFTDLCISDHYLPWLGSQGHSAFVWSVIGGVAAATERVSLTTFVTCPTIRIHPAIIAQAAATCAVMLDGRFTLGLGSGENLNEHVLGDRWPDADERLDLLEEAIDVIRELWTGDLVSYDGDHYRVVNARIHDLPEEEIPIHVSAFGPKAVALAAELADGYVSSAPLADLVERYRAEGGVGPAVGGLKVCYHEDEETAVETAHRLWANEALPGELSQELPTTTHYEQATSLVTPEQVAASIPCGPDPERHLEGLGRFADAGFDLVYVQPVGGRVRETLDLYEREVLPRLG